MKMKLVLRNASGIGIEVNISSEDKFCDIARKVSKEHGVILDVNEFGSQSYPISPSMNVLQYMISTRCYERTGDGDINNSEKVLNSSITEERCLGNSSIDICRLCAGHRESSCLFPLTDHLEKIRKCLPFTVAKDDELSQKICNVCIIQLNKVFAFVKSCLHADTLQKSLKNNGTMEKSSSSSVMKEMPPKTYYCDICQRHFRSKFRLSFHLQLHENGRKEGCCIFCDKEFPTEACLFRHFLNSHKSRKAYPCSLCGKSLGSKSSLSYHIRLHTSLEAMKPYICDECGRRFARKNILRDHLMLKHGAGGTQSVPVFECSDCKELFPTQQDAMTHLFILHDSSTLPLESFVVSKVFICEFCEKCYIHSHDMLLHRLSHKAPEPFLCKFCNEEFTNYATLRTHIDAHGRDGMFDYKTKFLVPVLFTCEFCETCFLSYQSFRLHYKGHKEPSPYKCLFCAETFSKASLALEHRLTHGGKSSSTTSVKPFDCHICGKSFTTSSSLAKHRRVHSGEKPFKCQICSKHFSQSSGLSSHKKVHSDVRPYICDLCYKAFKSVGDYKSHVRRHCEEKLFICSFCSKSFITRQSWQAHQHIHASIDVLK